MELQNCAFILELGVVTDNYILTKYLLPFCILFFPYQFAITPYLIFICFLLPPLHNCTLAANLYTFPTFFLPSPAS
jgi:hypothetical protein